MKDKKCVMILGAGYGGIFAAANLCKRYEGMFNITIIDKNPYHQLLQQIHFLISGMKEADDITIPVQDLFGDRDHDISVVTASAESIDFNSKTVSTNHDDGGGRTTALSYDYIIIALGAETQYFGVDGARQHCLPFRSVQDALKIKERVESLTVRSTVVIAGGGPSGVSLAAALCELPAVKRNNIKIKIIDSSDNLLPGWDERLSVTSEKALAARDIEIVTGSRIVRVGRDFVNLDSGEKLSSDCTIWTAGVKGCSIKTVPEVKRTKSGRIVVDRYSRVPGFEDAFAVGDISAYEFIEESGKRTPAPQLAQFAVRQARFVADNIARKERGECLNDTLSFIQRGHTIALGANNIGLLSGLIVTGRMCDYTEDSIVDNFITEIKNREQGISARSHAASREIEAKHPGMQYPAPFDFVTYATSQGFSDLVR